MTTEQRKSNRKIYKTKALVAFDGKGTVAGRTVDIGADGVSVSLPDPVPAGLAAHVRFDLLIDGKPNTITARCKVIYCIFSHDAFKIGLNFINLDTAANSVVTRFLR